MGEITKAEQSIERWASFGNLSLIGETDEMVLHHQATLHILKAEYETAEALARERLEAAIKANKDAHDPARVIPQSIMSSVYRNIGQWEKSLTMDYARLEAYKNFHSIISMHASLGRTYLSMGEWAKVTEECEASLNMSPSPWGMPRTVTPLGDAYCKSGQLDKGINLLEHWLEYAKRVGRGILVECEYCFR